MPILDRVRRAGWLLTVSSVALVAGCGESVTSTADVVPAPAVESLPQAPGLVLIEPPPITERTGIDDTGLPDVQLALRDGCLTAVLGNGETVTLHFFDGYAGFDGTTLFFRPLGDPDSVPATFQDGDRVGITGHDASPAMDYVVPAPSNCPSEGTVVYLMRRL